MSIQINTESRQRFSDRLFRTFSIITILVFIFSPGMFAACDGDYSAPSGYYSSADTSSSAALRASLHNIIKDNVKFSYATAWTVLEDADEDPGNGSNIIDVYKNASYTKTSHYPTWDREHTWPNSYGFPNEGDIPYTDCHHLRACDHGYNGDRGNLPFDDTGSSATELTTDVNNGFGGGSGSYPGHSDWVTTDEFQVWDHMKGDVARSLFYLDVRYEGGIHTPTGNPEPDLVLTNNMSLIEVTEDSPAYMGRLDTLLQWHLDDPVDDCERRRNDVVYDYQDNRNPFVDHPEWVCIIWGSSTPCQGATTPTATPTSGQPGTGDPWINEIHYDDGSKDSNEGIEVAGPAGLNMTGYNLIAYNGSNGTVYSTVPMSGTLPDQQDCLGTQWYAIAGLQNGAPDGIALVGPGDVVIQFLSWEGTFTAAEGPANGMTSADIGVTESGGTLSSESLQLGGTGNSYDDFTWQTALANTHAAVNQNQVFSGGCSGTPEPSSTPIPSSTPTPEATDTPTTIPSSTPTSSFTPSGEPWINEIHYDDSTKDSNEGMEVAGPAGLDMTGYSFVAYNGANGLVYATLPMSGTLTNQQGCIGTQWYSLLGLQNGPQDGLALVGPGDAVIQLLSWEGTFTAVDGPAAGLLSVDIGVMELNSTPGGYSLQLGGTGSGYNDFSWQAALPNTMADVNQNQVFSGCGSPTEIPTVIPSETPTPMPSDTPIPSNTPNPTATPTTVDTPIPSATPTSVPSNTPVITPPSQTPTPEFTAEPTTPPTAIPTAVPSETPEPTPDETVTPTPITESIPTMGTTGLFILVLILSFLLITVRKSKRFQ